MSLFSSKNFWPVIENFLRSMLRQPRPFIAYVEIRQLANEYGWQIDNGQAPSASRAHDLEIQMRQAAACGDLRVEGRKCTIPIELNPLLPVPPQHFNEFEFAHGYLHRDNVKNISTYTTMIGKERHEAGEKNFCDLYVLREDIQRLLQKEWPNSGMRSNS